MLSSKAIAVPGCLVDLVELERSVAPPQHKKARRAWLRRHHAAICGQRRRMEASTLCRCGGSERLGSAEIGGEVEPHCGGEGICVRLGSQDDHWGRFVNHS